MSGDRMPVSFVYVSDGERAVAFYRDVLGLAVKETDAHGYTLGSGKALLRLTVMPDHAPSPHPVFGFAVTKIDSHVDALRTSGVTFTALGATEADVIWTSPDGGAKLAFFSDPEGNALMLSERVR